LGGFGQGAAVEVASQVGGGDDVAALGQDAKLLLLSFGGEGEQAGEILFDGDGGGDLRKGAKGVQEFFGAGRDVPVNAEEGRRVESDGVIEIEGGAGAVPALHFGSGFAALGREGGGESGGVAGEFEFDVAEELCLGGAAARGIWRVDALFDEAGGGDFAEGKEDDGGVVGGESVIEVGAVLEVEAGVVEADEPIGGMEAGGDVAESEEKEEEEEGAEDVSGNPFRGEGAEEHVGVEREESEPDDKSAEGGVAEDEVARGGLNFAKVEELHEMRSVMWWPAEPAGCAESFL